MSFINAEQNTTVGINRSVYSVLNQNQKSQNLFFHTWITVEGQHIVVQNSVYQADVVAAFGDQNVGILHQVDHDGLDLLWMLLEHVQHILGGVVLEMLEF